MKIINFDKGNSLISQYMSELRDVNIQNDRLRFRRNLERIGQIMAFLKYRARSTTRRLTSPHLSECRNATA